MTSLAFLAIAPAIVGQSNPSLASISQRGLRDVAFTWNVNTADQRELVKINRDFANSMRFRRTSVEMEEPFKLRMESTLDGNQIVFIVNGTRKVTRIPRTGLTARDDVSRAPGKRQTFFDFGILTPSLFNNFLVASFVRTEARGEFSGALVYDVKYAPGLNDTSRHRIWVDRSKGLVRKREWYAQNGALRAVFIYSGFTTSNGASVPTQLRVLNAEGRQAATSTFTGVRMNAGIADERFSLN